MKIGLMVEGQNGLTWERWRHILGLAERLRFPTVFRSDHYFIGRQQDSLEAYLSFAIAAAETSTVRFGPLVSPMTFRSPVDVGRMAAQIDLLSGGRFVMGLGAGWNEPEHRAYGIAFPPMKERFDRLDEAIQVIQGLWGDGPASFAGKHFQLDGADCLPKPPAGRPPILIGGGGEKRTLKLVANYASEWNGVNLTAAGYRHKVSVLERHCADVGRDPSTISHSMMCFGVLGPSPAAVDAAVQQRRARWPGAESMSDAEFRAELKANGNITGGTEEVLDQLGRLAEAGCQEIQFQHLFFDSDEIPEYLAAEIAPAAARFA